MHQPTPGQRYEERTDRGLFLAIFLTLVGLSAGLLFLASAFN